MANSNQYSGTNAEQERYNQLLRDVRATLTDQAAGEYCKLCILNGTRQCPTGKATDKCTSRRLSTEHTKGTQKRIGKLLQQISELDNS